jgi:hypothetical protein
LTFLEKVIEQPSQNYVYRTVFSIPLKKINGVRIDTAKNASLGKALLVGFFTFSWKDKILAIDFKDDLGTQNTAFFKGGRLEEIRNQIIANRYTLHKKKNPTAQKKAYSPRFFHYEHDGQNGYSEQCGNQSAILSNLMAPTPFFFEVILYRRAGWHKGLCAPPVDARMPSWLQT